VGFSAGPSSYDLAGTGTGFVAHSRFSLRVGSSAALQGTFGYLRYVADLEESTHYLLPEVSIVLAPRIDNVELFTGTGAGWALFLNGRGESDFTLHSLVGIRVWVSGSLGTTFELRVRSIDPFVGNTTDITLGFDYRW
jgi:hypothetical protein